MSNLIVGISDWKVCRKPEILVTYALGSCVGTCMYDRTTGVAGLSHIMLPDSTKIIDPSQLNRMKFADTALGDMLRKMVQMGANPARIQAKIAGGAVMFATKSDQFNIGERNIIAVKKSLGALKIPIVAQDVGLDYGRTVVFHSEDFKVEIKSTIKGIHVI